MLATPFSQSMAAMNDLSDQAVQFGPYRIHPRQRLVLEGGRPLRLGRRAVDS